MAVCFTCDNVLDSNLSDATKLFTDVRLPYDRKLSDVVQEIIAKEIPEHASDRYVCKVCYKNCLNYVKAESRLNLIKTNLQSQFNVSPTKSDTINQNEPKQVMTQNGPCLVVNKSDLLKMNLSVKNCTVTSNSVDKFQPNPKIPKIVVQKADLKPINLNTLGNETKNNLYNRYNINLVKRDPLENVQTNTVETDPLDIKENLTEQEMSAVIMDVDGDTQESNTEINSSLEHVKTEGGNPGSPIRIEAMQDDTDEEFVIGKVEFIGQQDCLSFTPSNEDEDTILMNGEDGSLIKVVSGQKFMYGGNEISLIIPQESENGDEDCIEISNQDSNDYSQIEIIVSEDEESSMTEGSQAKDSKDYSQIEFLVSEDEDGAITEGTQDKAGAFIKMESGKIYEVKSIQSNIEPAHKIPDQAHHIVKKIGKNFVCLLCTNKYSGNSTTKKFVIVSTDPATMISHLKDKHAARIYICSICHAVIRKKADYTKHLNEHGIKTITVQSKKYECGICDKKCTSKTLLEEHINMHTGVKPYTCKECGKSFSSKYTLQSHMKIHKDRPRLYKCNACKKSFYTQQNLNQHVKTHSDVRDFACPVCDKRFVTQHNLEVHSIVHTKVKSFECGICSKSFARKAEIADHMRVHTGERPFACDLCPSKFSQRSNLLSHKRATHFNDKRHACQQCGKRFKRRRLLNYHIKAVHDNTRELVCEICKATFVYPEHFKKHKLIHTGQKPYSCEVCGRAFSSKNNRNAHRFMHSTKKPYECVVCGVGYMRKRMLYTHMHNTGHLSDSIVINQPKVSQVDENLPTISLQELSEPVPVNETGSATFVLPTELVTETDLSGLSFVQASTEDTPQQSENAEIKIYQVKLANGEDGWIMAEGL